MPTTLGTHLCLKYDFDIGVSVHINTIINVEVLAVLGNFLVLMVEMP